MKKLSVLYRKKNVKRSIRQREPPTELTFGWSFNQPLKQGTLPPFLTTLTFGYEFNQPLEPGVLPASLMTLKFGDEFNQPLEPGVLPSSLTTLMFGKRYNQPLAQGVFPTSLMTLEFGYSFNQELEPGVLPPSLPELILMSFNKKLEPGVLPSSLTTLTLGSFNQPLKPGVLPPSLPELILMSFNKKLEPGVLPSSLTTLTLGSFNQPLKQGVFPSSLTTLTLRSFNKKLEPGVLPSSLTTLYFGEVFNKSITPGVLPEGLKELVMHDYSVIEKNALPESLKNSAVYFHMEWNTFIREYNTLTEDQVKLKLKEFYLRGFPVPVEPFRESTLKLGKLKRENINYYSLNREEHLTYHRNFSARLQNLLNEWVYGDYGAFNTFISKLNGENVERERPIPTEFLSGYSSAEEAYKEMRESIMSVPPLDHDIFAWRGVHEMEDLCNITKVGDIVCFSRLTACSVEREVSCFFARDGELLLLEIPKGTNLLNLTSIKKSEPEFILPDRCCFRLMNRFAPQINCPVMTCKEILHLKLIGIYNKDKTALEVQYDTLENISDKELKEATYY